MGNTCSSSKGSYDSSNTNPWLSAVGSTESSVPSSTAQQSCIPAVHAGSILGSASATSLGTILTCGEDKRIALFDWENPTDHVYYEGHKRPVNQVSTI